MVLNTELSLAEQRTYVGVYHTTELSLAEQRTVES